VPAGARVTVRNERGDITVSTSDSNEIRVSGKKKVTTWNEDEAQKIAEPASVEIVQNGDGYEIHRPRVMRASPWIWTSPFPRNRR